VSTHSYAGIPDPAQPGHARLRYVHSDGLPPADHRRRHDQGRCRRRRGPAARTGTVVALAATGDLDAQWMFLLDPGTDTLTVHTRGVDVVGSEPVAS
jgi:hypothetical protein